MRGVRARAAAAGVAVEGGCGAHATGVTPRAASPAARAMPAMTWRRVGRPATLTGAPPAGDAPAAGPTAPQAAARADTECGARWPDYPAATSASWPRLEMGARSVAMQAHMLPPSSLANT